MAHHDNDDKSCPWNNDAGEPGSRGLPCACKPKPPDAERGLYRKYLVLRTDGSSGPGKKHERCDMFVLDLDHDRHALAALEAYATSCADEFPALYDDLNDKLAKLSLNRRCTPPRKRGDTLDRNTECSEPAVVPLGNGSWFCVTHAVDYHERFVALHARAQATLRRRGVTLGPGRSIGPTEEDA